MLINLKYSKTGHGIIKRNGASFDNFYMLLIVNCTQLPYGFLHTLDMLISLYKLYRYVPSLNKSDIFSYYL